MNNPKHDTHVSVFPVSGLQITDAVSSSFRVDRVHFVTLERLKGTWGGVDVGSELEVVEKRVPDIYSGAFPSGHSYAVVVTKCDPTPIRVSIREKVREELAILTFSQLFDWSRKALGHPRIADESPGGMSTVIEIDGRGRVTPSYIRIGPVVDLSLDKNWKQIHESNGFAVLVKILQGEIRVAASWQRKLRNAAVLIGQSLVSTNVPQAFLWNMIAIELLLTEQQDKVVDELPNRAEALLGWATEWSTANYAKRIRDAYGKRCSFVHEGKRECINDEDVEFTDLLAHNLMNNLLHHHGIFKSQPDVIEFSRKVAAEQLLGIPPGIRPSTLRMWVTRTSSLT